MPRKSFSSLFPTQRKNGKTIEYVVLDSHGDGNCFFYTVTRAIVPGYSQMQKKDQIKAGKRVRDRFMHKVNEQIYHNTMTKIRRDQQKKNRQDVVQEYSYREFKNKIGDFRTWADAVIISVVALLLNFNLIFFDSTNGTLYSGIDNFDRVQTKGWKTIVIEWQDHSHFNLIAQKTTFPNKSVEIRMQFDSKEDAAFLRSLFDIYQSQQ